MSNVEIAYVFLRHSKFLVRHPILFSSSRSPLTKSETGPRAQISQQVWCATPKCPPPANAVQGLEPNDRNRFGVLPNLAQLSLPSSLSRRSAQLKATKSRISSCSCSASRCSCSCSCSPPCRSSLDSIRSTSTVSLSTSTESSSAY